jgi:hypothetical protein
MNNMMGTAERHQEVNKVMEDVIAKMQSLGATVEKLAARLGTDGGPHDIT